jgi:hypothetical protein
MHEQVHQRTTQEQEIGKCAKRMPPMMAQKPEQQRRPDRGGEHDHEALKNPRHRYAFRRISCVPAMCMRPSGHGRAGTCGTGAGVGGATVPLCTQFMPFTPVLLRPM